jgi:hypothetical protein
VVVTVVMFTLASAAANLIPVHRLTTAQLRAAELETVVEHRRTRIAELRAVGDGCAPAHAHDLARLLVLDGQWMEVREFANRYEQRCGIDPVVRHWGDAPRPRTRGVTTR